MATPERAIKLVRASPPATEEASRRKAEFDAQMHMIWHCAKYTDSTGAEYMVGKLSRVCVELRNRFGLKLR